MPPRDHLPLSDFQARPEAEMRARAEAFHAEIRCRHSLRDFSDRPVPRDIIETCLRAAGKRPVRAGPAAGRPARGPARLRALDHCDQWH